MNITDWLEDRGLGKYAAAFTNNEIDLATLPEITDDDLREMGLPIGPRRKLLKAAKELATELRQLDTNGNGDQSTIFQKGDAERRQITVMFCDLVGSTFLSEKLDPEDLRELMTIYQQTSRTIIEHYEGHIAQYLGDGLMVYFGWPIAHEDGATRAVQASLELTDAVRNIKAQEPLQVRIGVATGQVVVGATGDGDASVPNAAVGETPNLAARLQGLAGPDQIIVAPTTHALTGAAFEYVELGEQRLKGIADAVNVWRVQGESTVEGRFEARTGGTLTPFVGRESEIALLVERWGQARHGEGQVVLISGEPGIGKSRITHALKDQLGDQHHLRIRYQCSPYYNNTALYPFIDQLERAAGLVRDATTDSQLDDLESLLNRDEKAALDEVALIASLLSLPIDRYQPINLDPSSLRAKTIQVLRDQILRQAVKHPLLMIFEDAHWADPSTIDLLTALIDSISDTAVLLVITHRPEFEPIWDSYGHVTLHSLNRLSRLDGSRIVELLARDNVLPQDVLEQIVANTDGVPLFVEELTKSVLETTLSKTGGSGDVKLASMAIPATLKDSLTARLDRIASGKEIAQLAACIGREFNYTLLLAIAQDLRAGLDAGLTSLVNAGLLHSRGRIPEATYTFKHNLIQETAYQSLLKSRRRFIHGLIAEALESQFDTTEAIKPELLAYHHTRADRGEQAIVYWEKAGEQAKYRSANAEAISHFSQALDILQAMPVSDWRHERELNLQVGLAVPLAASTGFASEQMEAVYKRARSLCDQVSDTSSVFPVFYGLWDFYLVRADYASAYEEARGLLNLVEGQQDNGLLLEAHRAAGATLYYRGEFLAAQTHLKNASAAYEPRQHGRHVALYRQDPGVACLSYSAWALWILGYPQQAVENMDRALGLARELGHPFSVAWALNFSGRLHEFRREGDVVQARAEEVIELATEHGFTYWLAWATVLRGFALVLEGEASVGTTEIGKGISAIENTGTAIARSQDLGVLALAQITSLLFTDSLATVSEALTFIEQTDERYYEAELHRLKGNAILATRGSDRQLDIEQQAEACFREAMRVAQRQQAKSWELRAGIDLARLLQHQGKTDESVELLYPIYNWFNEGFDTKDLQDAKAILDELGDDLS